jgi:hypothetical protein
VSGTEWDFKGGDYGGGGMRSCDAFALRRVVLCLVSGIDFDSFLSCRVMHTDSKAPLYRYNFLLPRRCRDV